MHSVKSTFLVDMVGGEGGGKCWQLPLLVMAEIGTTRMEVRKDTICGKLTGGRMSEDCGVGGRRARKREGSERERHKRAGSCPKGRSGCLL